MRSRTVSESLPLSKAMLWAQGCRWRATGTYLPRVRERI